jgi:hypothetical protein
VTQTLDEAKAWLRSRVFNEDRTDGPGAVCPCCNRWAQTYRYSISSAEARTLVEVYRRGGTTEFIHVSKALPQQWAHKVSQLRFWGLVEEESVRRLDGGRAGWWRVTALGAMFVTGGCEVLKYVHVWDASVVGRSGPPVSIVDAIRNTFDLREVLDQPLA